MVSEPGGDTLDLQVGVQSPSLLVKQIFSCSIAGSHDRLVLTCIAEAWGASNG